MKRTPCALPQRMQTSGRSEKSNHRNPKHILVRLSNEGAACCGAKPSQYAHDRRHGKPSNDTVHPPWSSHAAIPTGPGSRSAGALSDQRHRLNKAKKRYQPAIRPIRVAGDKKMDPVECDLFSLLGTGPGGMTRFFGSRLRQIQGSARFISVGRILGEPRTAELYHQAKSLVAQV